MDNIPYYNAEKVSRSLQYEQLIPVIEETLAKFSSNILNPDGSIDQPLRATTSVKQYNGFLTAMPAYVGSSHNAALACKLVSFFPDNASKDLHTHVATILLFDETTGLLKASMDGEVITAMRTAAVSVVATKFLARDTATLAVLGTGVQAKSHIEAFLKSFPTTKVNIWNHRPAGTKAMVDYFKSIKPQVHFVECSNVEECVADADVVVCATFATEPVLNDVPMKPWVHINSVGAPRPNWQEVGADLMTTSTVYVDSYQSAKAESGDIIISGAEIYAEIGEVVLGRKEARQNQRTIFKSLGMAVEDAVSAQLVYQAMQSEANKN